MYDPNKSNYVRNLNGGGTAYAPGINPQYANQPNWQAGANAFKNSPYGQNPSPLGKSLLAPKQAGASYSYPSNSKANGYRVTESRSLSRPSTGDPTVDQAYKDAAGRGLAGLLSGRYAAEERMDASSKGYLVGDAPGSVLITGQTKRKTLEQYADYLNKALKKGPQAYEEAMRLVRQILGAQPTGDDASSVSPMAMNAYIDAANKNGQTPPRVYETTWDKKSGFTTKEVPAKSRDRQTRP
jgi:hypothetical protein